jgi:hypothetical protein
MRENGRLGDFTTRSSCIALARRTFFYSSAPLSRNVPIGLDCESEPQHIMSALGWVVLSSLDILAIVFLELTF